MKWDGKVAAVIASDEVGEVEGSNEGLKTSMNGGSGSGLESG
jgi:hypothetical protein